MVLPGGEGQEVNLSDLLEEVYARGFRQQSHTAAGIVRVTRWVNQAVEEINDYMPWPWLEATETGTAPLAVSDLKLVLSVTDTTNPNPLWPTSYEEVLEADPTLAATGTPESYYFDGQSTLRVYPANTSDTISVRYVKTTAELAAAGDEPTIPEKYHDLIVDLAVLRAHKDKDNYDAVNVLRQLCDRELYRLSVNYGPGRSLEHPEQTIVRGDS